MSFKWGRERGREGKSHYVLALFLLLIVSTSLVFNISLLFISILNLIQIVLNIISMVG
jgi:hypothetical protein